jgi:uroporphyrinogen-III synthase
MHKEGLAEAMEAEGFVFDKAVIYRTLSSDLSDIKKKFNYDIIAFFSPSGLKSLFENFPKFKQNTTRIAAFGRTTAKAVLEYGLKLDIEAPLPELPSMASALENYLSISNKR